MKSLTKFKKNIIFLKELWPLILILLSGALLRFYDLNWDQGYFFNPDESNNITHPAANLTFPLHPEKFVYGSLTIYLYRLLGLLIAFLTQNRAWLTAAQISLIGRTVSAIFSIVIIFLVFYLGKKVFSLKTGLLAAIFTSFNVGLIQAAHFGTTETIITFAGILTVISAFMILKKKNYWLGYFLGLIILGLAAGAKVSTLVFLPTLLLAHLLSLNKKSFINRNLILLSGGGLMFLTFFFVFPYSLLDFPNFKEAFLLEKSIATGENAIFFTTQFLETKPYFFQLIKILPWILGWPVLIFGLLGTIALFFQSIKEVSRKKYLLFFLPTFYFLFNGSLFVKWTRYMVPLAPFFCLFAAYFLIEIAQKYGRLKRSGFIASLLVVAIVAFQILYGFAFLNIYRQPSTKITASEWIYQNLPPKSTLLLEPLDVTTLPLPINHQNSAIFNQVWFDFYAIDDPQDWPAKIKLIEELSQKLAKADYVIIGSRRVYANRLRLNRLYPLTSKYYSSLFDGTLGFDKIKEFSVYPEILGIKINDDMAEETFQVFDHPKVLIFKNTMKLSASDLKDLLLNYE